MLLPLQMFIAVHPHPRFCYKKPASHSVSHQPVNTPTQVVVHVIVVVMIVVEVIENRVSVVEI